MINDESDLSSNEDEEERQSQESSEKVFLYLNFIFFRLTTKKTKKWMILNALCIFGKDGTQTIWDGFNLHLVYRYFLINF